MRFIVVIFTAVFLLTSCQSNSSKVEVLSNKQTANLSTTAEIEADLSSIRKVNFQNFTFPWTKTFGFGEKTFTLKNGTTDLADERKLTLENVTYVFVADEYDEQALVNVNVGDGNATYQMLFVYAIENGNPKLLESFEFSEETNNSLRAAFDAHGELIIEIYNKQMSDAECCPSIIEISYYKWQKGKFVLQGEPQRVPNGYVERVKKSRVK